MGFRGGGAAGVGPYNGRMPNYVSDNAICLRVLDFSETSQIVTLLTERHGVVGVIAKGSKRQTKKGGPGGSAGGAMSGPLDLLTAGQVVFIPAREGAGGGGAAGGEGGGGLGTLTGWNLTDHRSSLRTSLAGLNGAMVAAEVTLGLLQPHDPHEELFPELEAALNLLAGPQRARGLVSYLKAALGAAGYLPQLEACLVCGRAIGGGGAGGGVGGVGAEEMVRFSAEGSGVICGACQGGGKMIEVAAKIVMALERLPAPRQLAANPPERAADLGALRTAAELLLAEYEAVVGRGLRTRALVEGVFR